MDQIMIHQENAISTAKKLACTQSRNQLKVYCGNTPHTFTGAGNNQPDKQYLFYSIGNLFSSNSYRINQLGASSTHQGSKPNVTITANEHFCHCSFKTVQKLQSY